MSRKVESDTFNLSNSDIYEVMRSVFGANTISRYPETDSRNVPFTGAPQSTYGGLQVSERSSANEMYGGSNIHLPSLMSDGRIGSSAFQEKYFSGGAAYNVSDSSALEAALQGFRPSAPQSALGQDWNQEYGQNHRLKELFNLERSNTTQTLSESPKNIPYSSNVLNQMYDAESSVASSDAASCKPFNDLNLNTVDEEDEFLYGDSNSLPEIPKSVKEDPVENKQLIVGTGWSDDEDPYNDITDDSLQDKSMAAQSVWDARKRCSKMTKPSLNLLHNKLSDIKHDKKALPRTAREEFLPPMSKEPFVPSPKRREEPNRKFSPSDIRPQVQKSKYHAAAEILKNKILEKTRSETKSSSSERISESVEYHKVSETDSRVTSKSGKILVSNKPDIKTDKLPVNPSKHLPKAFVEKNIENYIKGFSGKRIHPGEELEQESKHVRYELARKVSPHSPHEIVRHDYRQQPRPRSSHDDKLPSPHLSRPPNVEHERKVLESSSRYSSFEKHKQYSRSPEKGRGSHDKSPGRYRYRMKSPGSHRSRRSRSPHSHWSRERSRSRRRHRSHDRSRSPRRHRSRERSRSPKIRRSRERSRSPKIRRSRERSRSPKIRRSRERSKSPKRHESPERKTVVKDKSCDKTKKSLSAVQKKTEKKGKSRDDSSSSSRSSSSSSSSFCSISFDSGSSGSGSSFESSVKRERKARKIELLKKKANDKKNKIAEGSTKKLDVVTVKKTDTATPVENLAKKISDILNTSMDASTNSSNSDPDKIQMLASLIENVEESQYLNEIFEQFTQNHASSSTVQDYSAFLATVAGGDGIAASHSDSQIPASEPYAYPSTPYSQSSQADFHQIPPAPISTVVSHYDSFPQYTFDVPNVINIIPQSKSTDFANEKISSTKQTKAPNVRKPTLRQIEVSSNTSSRHGDSDDTFHTRKSASDTSVKNLSHKISKETFEKKVQEIKEKRLMKGTQSESEPAAESNSKGDKSYYIEKYKKLEADRQLMQQITRTSSNDVAEMLNIMNNTFGRKISTSEKLIHSKCKNIFNVSRETFKTSIKEAKTADENLKKFKSEIPLEFEKDVLAVKVDPSKEEASEEVYTCYDSGDHLCFLCNEKFSSISNMMDHIQSAEHKTQALVSDNNWKTFFTKDKTQIDEKSKKKSVLQAVKGVEFMKPLTGFFCDLCKETILENTTAEQHLKSHSHYVKFKSFMKKNPLYERKLLLKRYAQIIVSTKMKQAKEMEENKRISEENKKREEEANERAKTIVKNEKNREIKVEELEDSEIISVSNTQSSTHIKVNLSSPEKKAQKEPEAKPSAKFVFIGKAPNFKKSQNQTATKSKALPWYKRESFLKSSDAAKEEKSSETKEKPLKIEEDSPASNVSQSKDCKQEQKPKVSNESNASKKEISKYSHPDSTDVKSSKSKPGLCGSQSASASTGFSACKDIPLPEVRTSKPHDQPSKVEEVKSVPMEIDNSQDPNFKPVVPSEEEKDFMILGIHKDDFKPLVIPVPPPNQTLSYSTGGTQSCLANLNFSVPPPSVAPYENRPPMSISYPAQQNNAQSGGLYSYPSNNDPSRSMYSNPCNMQTVPPFTNVPPPSYRNPPPMNTYPNPSNVSYMLPPRQHYPQIRQHPPTNMSPMQAYPNTNRFSMPPPVQGPPAYRPPGSNPSYPMQSNVPSSLPTSPQTFVCNPSFVSPPKPVAPPGSSIQSKPPSFKNQASKSNLIEIVPTKKQVPLSKHEKVPEPDTKSVKNKETLEKAPVSSKSEVTNTQTSLNDNENVKKDSSQSHTKIILNLKESSEKKEKDNIMQEVSEKVSEMLTESENLNNAENSNLGEPDIKVEKDSVMQNVSEKLSAIPSKLENLDSTKISNSKVTESQDEKDATPSEISSKSDIAENNKTGVIVVGKCLRDENQKTKKQNLRRIVKSRIGSASKNVAGGKKIKKSSISNEPDDLTNKTNEESAMAETLSNISDTSQNVTDSTTNKNEEFRLDDCITERSEVVDTTLNSGNYEHHQNESEPLPPDNSPPHSNFRKAETEEFIIITEEDGNSKSSEAQLSDSPSNSIPEDKMQIDLRDEKTSKRSASSLKLEEKVESSVDASPSSQKQVSASSKTIETKKRLSNKNTGKKIIRKSDKSRAKGKKVLSSDRQKIKGANVECNKISAAENFEMSMEVSKFYEELGHSSTKTDDTSSQIQESAVDLESMQKENENVVSQASPESELKDKKQFKVKEVDRVEEPDSTENVSEAFNLTSTSIDKEEISEIINPPANCNEVLPDFNIIEPGTREINYFAKEGTSEISSSPANCNEVLPDINTVEPDTSNINSFAKEETSEISSSPANYEEKSEAMEVDSVEKPDSFENVSEALNLPSKNISSEEISGVISSPANCHEILPDINIIEADTTGINNLVKEETSEIISPSANCNEILPDINTTEPDAEKMPLAEKETSEIISSPADCNEKCAVKEVEEPNTCDISETLSLSSAVNETSGDFMMTEIDSWAESGSSKSGSDTDEYEQET